MTFSHGTDVCFDVASTDDIERVLIPLVPPRVLPDVSMSVYFGIFPSGNMILESFSSHLSPPKSSSLVELDSVRESVRVVASQLRPN